MLLLAYKHWVTDLTRLYLRLFLVFQQHVWDPMRDNKAFYIGIYLCNFSPVVKELIFQFNFGSKKAYGSNNYSEMQEVIML